MNSCKFGLHKWTYTNEGKVRWCQKCHKKEEKDARGKWVGSRSNPLPKDETKFCECPRDYTISIRIKDCPHCGLPRRPR
jgi:hypothetical protein